MLENSNSSNKIEKYKKTVINIEIYLFAFYAFFKVIFQNFAITICIPEKKKKKTKTPESYIAMVSMHFPQSFFPFIIYSKQIFFKDTFMYECMCLEYEI